MSPALRCRDFQAADWPAIQELWAATGLGDYETLIIRDLNA